MILLFNIAGEKLARIRMIAARLGIDCIEIEPLDFSRTLEELTSRCARGEAPESAPFSEEMLIMDGLIESDFSALLYSLRTEGAAVALKAVVTEHNLCWTAAALAKELKAEHERLLEAVRAGKTE